MLLPLRKLPLEMTFNIFTTKRISCFGQYDRIDDLITCKLSSDKCPVFRQFLVNEFHFSAVFKCIDPLFVGHFSYRFRRDQGMARVYVVRCQKSRMGMKSRLLGIWHSNYARRTAPNLQKALRSDLYEGENYSVLPPPHEQRSEETRNRFN